MNYAIEEIRSILLYDPTTGVLTWKARRGKKIKPGTVAGSASPDCIQVMINGKNMKAHRLAWAIFYGKWPQDEIDHIDGNPTNNRIENLRDIPHRANIENRRSAQVNNSTGRLGVSFDKSRNKYTAKLTVSGVTKNLGRFDDADDAHAAYLTAKRMLHEGCTI